jgi:hypothetical protein
MPFLTIFSTPKPFTNPHIATIQRNAICSWTQLDEDVQVLIIGDEAGMAEISAELGVQHLPQVGCNQQGTPLVSSIFDLARQASQAPLLAYLNADILITPDFVQAARQVSAQAERFLMIGQRWDLNVSQPLDFRPGWADRLKQDTRDRGSLHAPAGSDYFVFPRPLYAGMPDFAIGRAGWDNWTIYHARSQGWVVVDITPDCMVIHQNHDYSHLPDGKPHYDLEESAHNQELAGGMPHLYMVLDSNRQLVGGKLRPPRPSLLRTLRRIEIGLLPADGRRDWRWSVSRRFRRMRRRLSGSL